MQQLIQHEPSNSCVQVDLGRRRREPAPASMWTSRAAINDMSPAAEAIPISPLAQSNGGASVGRSRTEMIQVVPLAVPIRTLSPGSGRTRQPKAIRAARTCPSHSIRAFPCSTESTTAQVLPDALCPRALQRSHRQADQPGTALGEQHSGSALG